MIDSRRLVMTRFEGIVVSVKHATIYWSISDINGETSFSKAYANHARSLRMRFETDAIS